MGNQYLHWRTPKLEAELAAVRKLKLTESPKKAGKSQKSLIAFENRRYSEIEKQIEGVLEGRYRKQRIAFAKKYAPMRYHKAHAKGLI